MDVHVRVRGPHAGVRLRHTAHGVLHCARAHAATAGTEGAGAEALGKHLQKGDGVRWQAEHIDAKVVTEKGPQTPGGGRGVAALMAYAELGCFLNSDPISKELVAGVRVRSCQGYACG